MPLSVGQRIGDYEVQALLGAGGMGEVYRARDTKLDRDVALKLLAPAFAADPERRARFEREAKLLAALSHAAVGQLYGFLEADGQPMLVLELAQGEDLQARLARGRVPLDEALSVAKQVAEALEAAHEKGIVHRDLKPANVMVAADGQVKVLDFGLAKAWDGEAKGAISGSAASQSPTLTHGGTEAGLLLGTAAYMSPEQARGRPVDKRADIWAFGVVVFEMLSGRRLFDGETITDVLAAVVRQEIDWSALPSDTPPRITRLLKRCLERDAKLRLRDIGEARIALAAPDEPAAAAAAPSGVSRRAAAALVAGAGGAAFALGFGLGRGSGGAGAAKSAETLTVTRITSSGNVTEAAISPDGRLVAYVESYQGGQSLWLRQLATGQTLRLVPERRGAYWGHVFTRDGNSIVYGYKGAGPEELDSFYSISTLGGTPRRLVAGIDSSPAFSPDGSRMAWVRARHPTPDESALMLARADGSEARVLAAFKLPERVAPIFFTAPDWSPDGRRIACSVVRRLAGAVDGGARIVAVGVDDGRVETLAEPQWTSAAQLAWLPDSSGLLAVGTTAIVEASQVWLVPLPSGEPRRVTTDLLEYRIVSLTADGRSLLTVAADAVASVWLGAPGHDEPPRRLTGSRLDGMFGLDFLPDGRLVYTSADSGDEALWVTSADASERTPLATGDGIAREPRATRSGRIFYLARTRSAGEVRSLSPDGSAPRVVASGAFGGGLAVSPDERQVVFTALGENEIRLFRVGAEGGTPEPVTDYAASFPAFSPDGKQLAFYYADRASGRFRIGIVAAEGGPILRSFDAAAPNFYSRMLFGADGLYVNSLETDRANVWLVPLDGKPPRRITSFQDSLVYGFAFSPDGRSLAYSRGPRTRDALLIRGFQ